MRVETIAGNGEEGYSGDGGSALDARLATSLTLDVGADGSVYVAEQRNGRVRVIDPDGMIDTVAGTVGLPAPEADGPEVADWTYSPGNRPRAVAVGDGGDLYVAAEKNVRRRNSDGRFHMIASSDGEAEPGDGGPALDAYVHDTEDVAVDADGNVYLADANRHRVRRIDTAGVITNVAGGGDLDRAESEGGPATGASVFEPHSVAVDAEGNVYFTETSRSSTVRRVDADGTITTVLGSGDEGYSGDGGPAAEAELSDAIVGVAVGEDGTLYVADGGHGHVRRVDPDGTIGTVGASVPGIFDVAVGPDGDLYVTAGANVKRIVPSGEPAGAETSDRPERNGSEDPTAEAPWAGEPPGTVVAVAGVAREASEDPDGVERPAPMPGEVPGTGPRGVAVGPDGVVYVADTVRHQVLRSDGDGSPTAVAGTGVSVSEDGSPDATVGEPADEVQLETPEDLAVDGEGNLYIADTGNDRVLVVGPDGNVLRTAGQAEGDGPGLLGPRGVAVGADGSIYVADTGNLRVRRITPDGAVTTIAGGGDLYAEHADNAPALDASLWDPVEVAVDPAGNVFVIEDQRQSVRRVGTDGVLTTVAGGAYRRDDEGGFAGDGGPATGAELNTPGGLAVAADGSLYIADTFNSRIRRVAPDGTIATVAGTGVPDDTGDAGPAAEADIDEPEDLAIGADGSVYLTGRRTEDVRRIAAEGTITTVTGTRPTGAEGTPAIDAELTRPTGIAIGTDGDLYISERQPVTGTGIRRVDRAGTIVDLEAGAAGEPLVGTTGLATALAAAPDGALYVADGVQVKRLDPDGVVTVVAGHLGIGGTSSDTGPQDGQSAIAARVEPTALAVGRDGRLYMADSRDAVFSVSRDGTIDTVVGIPDEDGTGRLHDIRGITVDDQGNLYVADARPEGGRVHRIAPDGDMTTILGGREGPRIDEREDGRLFMPTDVVVGDDGAVYVSEATGGIHRVEDGTLSTIGGSASDRTRSPASLALDDTGDLYVLSTDTGQVHVIVQPGDLDSGSSGWLIPPRLLVAVLVAVLAGVAVLRRDRLAALVRARLTRSPVPTDPPPTPDT